MATTGRQAKAERIEIRLAPDAKALLTAAARSRHTTVSEFLLTHGLAAAEQAVAMPRVFHASEKGWAAVQVLLDGNEDAPDAETVLWLARHREAE